MNKIENGLVGMWLAAALGNELQGKDPAADWVWDMPHGASLRGPDITWPAPLAGWLEREFGPELHKELGAMFLLQTMAMEREPDDCNQISWGIYFNVLVRAIYGYPMFQSLTDGVRGAYEYYKSVNMGKLFQEHFGWLLRWELEPVLDMKGENTREKISIALFCAYHNLEYTGAAVEAANWSGDSYTIAALTGLLSGVVYGDRGFPADWIDELGDGYVLQIALSMINEYDPMDSSGLEDEDEDAAVPPPIPFMPKS